MQKEWVSERILFKWKPLTCNIGSIVKPGNKNADFTERKGGLPLKRNVTFVNGRDLRKVERENA